MRQKVILGFALVLAVAAVAILNVIASQNQPEANLPTVEVLVAARNIERGQQITTTSIRTARWPRTYVHQSAIGVQEQDRIIDQRVVSTIPEGQPLLWSDLEVGGEGFKLSSAIEPGMRAVTVTVDNSTGLGGHIRPDDWVDVIGTFRIPRELRIRAENLEDVKQSEILAAMEQVSGGDGLSLDKVTVTLLQRVKVLAVGGMTGDGPVRRGGRQSAMAGLARGYNTVTLMVVPSQAEVISFASDMGTLSLALRNPDDMEIREGDDELSIFLLADILRLKKGEEKREPVRAAPRPTRGPRIID